MAKERLSKLQKWIIENCLKNGSIHGQDVYAFFGKKYSLRREAFWSIERFKEIRRSWYGSGVDTDFNFENKNGRIYVIPKAEYCITNSEKVIISRSLKNLANKGVMAQPKKYGNYFLTEKGLLKANQTSHDGESY